MNVCFICKRVEMVRDGINPYLIHEFKSSIFVMGDHQLYKGMSFLLLKNHYTELHQIPMEEYVALSRDLHIAGNAISKTFSPDKMNYSCLGNGDAHVHWHLIPRYKSDPDWGELPYLKREHPREHMISEAKARDLANLVRVNLAIAKV